MSLDFSDFEEGDDIEIEYEVYPYLDGRTTVASTVAGFNSADNLEWKAGRTGTGVIRENGHVFDGNGVKVGVDAEVSHLDT